MSKTASRRRVVITGVGAITPLGRNAAQTWNNLKEGRSAVGPMTLFDCSAFPTKIAAEIKKFDFKKEFAGYAAGQNLDNLNRHTQFALMAAWEAFCDGGLNKDKFNKERFGVYFAAGEGGPDFINYANCTIASLNPNPDEGPLVNKDLYLRNASRFMSGINELEQEPGIIAYHLSKLFQLRGPIANSLTACAASSQAIGEATEIIRRGDADIMMSGGAHSMIHPLGVIGFNLLTALSVNNADYQHASRPFDLKRDGFVIAEGSGVVILEELEHALKRKAHIYGELSGYGSTADAYRLTDAHSTGRGAVQAMKLALEDSGVANDAVGYISAHGTSTAVNDSIESSAIKQVFEGRAKMIPVSSIKSMSGHLIAAAGVVELIVCLFTIRDGIIPPTINYEFPDPDCDLDYVPNKARCAEVNCVVSNSFGFGGQNISLVAERYPSKDKT